MEMQRVSLPPSVGGKPPRLGVIKQIVKGDKMNLQRTGNSLLLRFPRILTHSADNKGQILGLSINIYPERACVIYLGCSCKGNRKRGSSEEDCKRSHSVDCIGNDGECLLWPRRCWR